MVLGSTVYIIAPKLVGCNRHSNNTIAHFLYSSNYGIKRNARVRELTHRETEMPRMTHRLTVFPLQFDTHR